MFTLSFEDSLVEINSLGTIDRWSGNEMITPKLPLYLVLFKEYSRIEPKCAELDISSSVSLISQSQTTICYEKQIEDLSVSCQIEIVKEGFDWTVLVNKPYPLHLCFGITMPFTPTHKLTSFGTPIKTPLAVYCRTFFEIFRDQSLLEFPSISSDHLTLFTSLDKNIQFFQYEQSELTHLRGIGYTQISNEMTFSLRSSDEDPSSLYIEKYPKSDSYINKWKQQLSELRANYNVKIIVQREENIDFAIPLKASPPKESDLSDFLDVLNTEIHKYSNDIFESLQVGGIYLCAELIASPLPFSGEPSRNQIAIMPPGLVIMSPTAKTINWIFIDVGAMHPAVLHHEIFHLIENEIGFEGWPSGGFFLFPKVQGKEKEYRADLFAETMLSPKKMRSLSIEHNILKQQTDFMRERVSKFVPSFGFNSESSYDDRFVNIVSGDDIKSVLFGKIPEEKFERCFFCKDTI